MPPEIDDDAPVTEDDLARMFEEEARAEAQAPVVSTPEPPPVEQPTPEVGEQPPPVVEPKEPPTPEPLPPAAEQPPVETPPVETPPEPRPEYLDWAERSGIGDFDQAAKKAYEQERYIGQRAAELRQAQEQAAAWQTYAEQLEQRRQSLGGVTDEWIQSGLMSPDPTVFAQRLWDAGDEAGYAKYMEAWEEYDPRTPRAFHQHLLTNVQPVLPPNFERPQEPMPQRPEPQGPDASIVRNAFAEAGVFDLQGDPVIHEVQKLLPANPEYQAMLAGSDQERATIAAKSLVMVARTRLATVATVRMTQQAEQQAAAEEARKAALVNGSSPSPVRTTPKPTSWDPIEEELRRMGAWNDAD